MNLQVGECGRCQRPITEDAECPLRDVTTQQCYAYEQIDMPLNNHRAMPPKLQMTNEQWFSLPMSLRERWWAETDYGEKQPSDALVQEVRQFLEGDKQ